MAKKLYAVTNIKNGSDFYEAGKPIDSSKFTKDQLVELHDSGAIVVKNEEDLENPDQASTTDLVGPGQTGEAPGVVVDGSDPNANPQGE